MLQDADEVGNDKLLLIHLAHLGEFSGGHSLKQQHFLIGNIHELSPDFLLVRPRARVHIAHQKGG